MKIEVAQSLKLEETQYRNKTVPFKKKKKKHPQIHNKMGLCSFKMENISLNLRVIFKEMLASFFKCLFLFLILSMLFWKTYNSLGTIFLMWRMLAAEKQSISNLMPCVIVKLRNSYFTE